MLHVYIETPQSTEYRSFATVYEAEEFIKEIAYTQVSVFQVLSARDVFELMSLLINHAINITYWETA